MDTVKKSVAEVITVDVHAAQNLLGEGHRYLDVRTEEEFKNGHLHNAFNIPYLLITPEGGGREKNPKFLEQVLAICTKEDNLILGCHGGNRSSQATADLLDAEFKHVINMGGGYKAWVNNGFAVEKPDIVEDTKCYCIDK